MSIDTETGQRRPRRVRLTPARSVPVEFAGERAAEGPLTLGQLNIYNWLSQVPDHFYAILCVELPVPAAVSTEDVAEAVATLIARHESLRTTYIPGDQPRQRVAAAGVQLVEVCSLGEEQWGPQDRPAVAEALIRWLRQSPHPTWQPVRIAVAITPGPDDRVIACAAAFSHMAVDNDAIEILERDFAELLGDPARRQAGRAGHQPLDQAELEATPAERRKADAALDYLREQSWRIPRCLYALPGARMTGEPLVVELSSVAGAMAVRRVAARTRTSRSSVVLAAICAVVARRAGYRELVFPVTSSNRFEPQLVNYVGALSQVPIVTVEIGGRSFDELAAHTWTTVMEVSRHGRYDAVRRDAMAELIEQERGLRVNYHPMFNSLVPESWSGLTAGVGFQPEEIDVALARTELRWRPAPVNGNPIQFSLGQVDGCLRLDVWNADSGLVPRAELESVLLAIERLLVAAADGDVPGARMPAVIGLEPLTGIPDRILVDSCWVDVADVQRLVEDAVAPAVARVFATAGGRPLVACLAATEAVRTPEEAHARCLAALDRHPAAITPRHYVICAAAPSDPDDPAAWPARNVRGSGAGRKAPPDGGSRRWSG
jgi:Condensation domain